VGIIRAILGKKRYKVGEWGEGSSNKRASRNLVLKLGIPMYSYPTAKFTTRSLSFPHPCQHVIFRGNRG